MALPKTLNVLKKHNFKTRPIFYFIDSLTPIPYTCSVNLFIPDFHFYLIL